MRTIIWTALLVAMSAAPALAAELAVLRNGFTIRHERRTVIGTNTRLVLDASGRSYVDVPTDQIAGYEAAPEQPAASAADAKASAIRSTTDLDAEIERASMRHRLDPDLLRSLIHAESDFNPKAISPKGARGLTQLMPETARRLGVEDTFDPQQNIEAGAQHLSNLLDRYHDDMVKALAAYNAGTDPVEQYSGVPPYRETQAYVARIVREFNRKKLAKKSAARAAGKPSAGDRRLSQSNVASTGGR